MLGQPQASHECFVFGLVVGGFEIEPDGVLEAGRVGVFGMWGYEDNSCAAPVGVGSAVHIQLPYRYFGIKFGGTGGLWDDVCRVSLLCRCRVNGRCPSYRCKLGDKICQYLHFDRGSWPVGDIELAELDAPLGQSPRCLGLLQDKPKRVVGEYRNKGSLGTGLLSGGALARYSFKEVKACSHSVVQPLNLFPVFSIRKSGAQRSVDLDMNRERATILPLRL
ncbi:hypothetical protein M0R45_027146 [Rubus argutus]|uniref:Uncharacterized protein n=1 Tax=Rubus argutus TaxID=59490 RepID=A0AAW1X241_RUBAR